MSTGDSVLDSILEEENYEDVEDVEMADVEEGELIDDEISKVEGRPSGAVNVNTDEGELIDDETLKVEGGPSGSVNVDTDKEGSRSKNHRRRKNKRKNKRKRGSSGPNVVDINRFVLDVCKRLKERKSYLVWIAVGCLGVSALSDLVKEVDAIQACGGQKTADGNRFRRGGGILWNILKTRDPNAYKEIMTKGKEFEKQLKPQNGKQELSSKKDADSGGVAPALTDEIKPVISQDSELATNVQKHKSVHDRLRMPVSYEDLHEVEDQKQDSTLLE